MGFSNIPRTKNLYGGCLSRFKVHSGSSLGYESPDSLNLNHVATLLTLTPILQLTVFFLPESPRWLYAQGYVEQATNVLARVYDAPEHSSMIQDTYVALKAEVDDEEKREEKGFALFIQCVKAFFWDTTELRLGRRLRLCFFIMMLQEMSGLNIVLKPSMFFA